MPKSKRNKVISLTKTAKKGSERKTELVESLRSCIHTYSYLFIFQVSNMRNAFLKAVRGDWKDSKFFFGKNRLMQIAFGRNFEESYRKDLFKISKMIIGDCGLLFTNTPLDKVQEYFNSYRMPDYARSGTKATESFAVKAGIIEHIPFSIEPTLRQLGLPTKLVNGKIELLEDTVVCKEGDTLTPEQCRLLKYFEIEMAVFQVHLNCYWYHAGIDDGEFHTLNQMDIE